MTQRYKELLKEDCQKYVNDNGELCKKWGQTTHSIFDFFLRLSQKLEIGGCSQRYMQEIVRRYLFSYIEIIRLGKTPDILAEEHLKTKQNELSEIEDMSGVIDEDIFKKKTWNHDEDERLKKMLLQGISLEKIAKFLHTTTSTIDCRIAYLKKKHLW